MRSKQQFFADKKRERKAGLLMERLHLEKHLDDVEAHIGIACAEFGLTREQIYAAVRRAK
jgi:hypothetical protein